MPPLDEEGIKRFVWCSWILIFYDDPKRIEENSFNTIRIKSTNSPVLFKVRVDYIFIYFFKTKAKGSLAIKYLKHVNKILKAKSKEIFPKQEKLKYNEEEEVVRSR